MSKILTALVLVLGLAAAPVAAHASPVTYDLTLTSITGTVAGGTGSLTVDSVPNNIYAAFFEGGAAGSALTALSFDIDGDTFTLANSLGGANAIFIGGSLSNITYAGTLANNSKVTIALSSNGLTYAFFDQLTGAYSIGDIAATSAGNVAPVPEPSTLMLLGTGVLSAAGVARRKFAA
jgi:hypothetical protein